MVALKQQLFRLRPYLEFCYGCSAVERGGSSSNTAHASSARKHQGCTLGLAPSGKNIAIMLSLGSTLSAIGWYQDPQYRMCALENRHGGGSWSDMCVCVFRVGSGGIEMACSALSVTLENNIRWSIGKLARKRAGKNLR